jgi:NAD(P)-dependent dehydrogenase (short-subunit alcohol dehydrogenase family)
MIDVNLKGAFFLAKEAAPHLMRSRGKFICIADTYGASPSAGFVPYGISKAGVLAMTRGLAKELAPEVMVNCVCPGVVEKKGSEVRGRSSEKKAIGASLLKRPVRAEDVADAVMFLARNDSMTGQALFVDGGRSSY